MSVPHMGEHEIAFVTDAFETNWLSSVGPNLDAFEREVVELLGAPAHAIAVSSGTAAIHLLLRAAGVGPGDRVVVQSATFVASAYPILYLGAEPVFVDSDDVSGGMDPGLLEECLRDLARQGTLPKAVLPAHLYGQHADIDAIADVCQRYEVALIEDAAESLGSTYKGRQTATTAPMAALSFNGNKIITTTGGGMAIARDPAVAARVRKWATQSREPAVEYVHAELGYNYRLSNVLAGIGRGQLRVLETRVAQRRRVFERYVEALGDVPGLRFQPEAPWGTHTRWLTVVHLDAATAPITPTALIAALDAENIEARPTWRPMHTQPLFAAARVYGGAVSERQYREGVCLPSSSRMTDAEQDRVIETIRAAALGQSAHAWT